MSVTTFPGRSRASDRPQYLVEYLEHWAGVQPDKTMYTFLDVDGRERDTYTYLGFHERTRHLAEVLRRDAGLKRGDRVLLVYPPGLEVIVAFVACSRIGVIPVPVYPPTPMNFEGGLTKLAFIAGDCGAKAALTTRGFLRPYRLLLAKRRISSLWRSAPGLPKLDWVTTDDVRGIGHIPVRTKGTILHCLPKTNDECRDGERIQMPDLRGTGAGAGSCAPPAGAETRLVRSAALCPATPGEASLQGTTGFGELRDWLISRTAPCLFYPSPRS